MSWPASTRVLVKAFTDGDRVMLGTKNRVQEISDDSSSGDVERRALLNIKDQLENLDFMLTTTISYGQDATDYARIEYRLPGLDVMAEYTAVRDSARVLALWIGDQISDGMPVTEAQNDIEVPLTFTTGQMADYRTNATLFTATIS